MIASIPGAVKGCQGQPDDVLLKVPGQEGLHCGFPGSGGGGARSIRPNGYGAESARRSRHAERDRQSFFGYQFPAVVNTVGPGMPTRQHRTEGLIAGEGFGRRRRVTEWRCQG